MVAALEFFGMQTVNDQPTRNAPPEGSLSKYQKVEYLQTTMRKFMDQVAPLHHHLSAVSLSFAGESGEQPMSILEDKIANYSHQVIELGLMLM